MYRTTFLMFMIVLSFTPVAAGDSIILRSAVRLAHDGPQVRLADVAALEGEFAMALADVVIGDAPRAGEVAEFSLVQIRSALDDAGVHWGRTHLNGRKVVVRSARPSGASLPRAMEPVSLEDESVDARTRCLPMAHLATDLRAENNLRSAIAEFLSRSLSVSPDRLRLTFDERDAALLKTSLSQRRFEIEPVSSVRSTRVDLAIRVWQADRIVDRRTVSVMPSVSTPVIVLTRDIERGGVMGAEDFEMQHQWHAPLANAGGFLRNIEDAAGRATVARLRKGDALRQSHLQRETIVRRGELVMVRCIVGGAVISLQAEARASATEGETIEFRKPGERDTFLATVTGRGAAIVDLARRSN